MALGNASGSASGGRGRAAGHQRVGVANQDLRPARQQVPARLVPLVQPPVQRPADLALDWLSDLPAATKTNAELLTIWPALDFDDETV